MREREARRRVREARRGAARRGALAAPHPTPLLAFLSLGRARARTLPRSAAVDAQPLGVEVLDGHGGARAEGL